MRRRHVHETNVHDTNVIVSIYISVRSHGNETKKSKRFSLPCLRTPATPEIASPPPSSRTHPPYSKSHGRGEYRSTYAAGNKKRESVVSHFTASTKTRRPRGKP